MALLGAVFNISIQVSVISSPGIVRTHGVQPVSHYKDFSCVRACTEHRRREDRVNPTHSDLSRKLEDREVTTPELFTLLLELLLQVALICFTPLTRLIEA